MWPKHGQLLALGLLQLLQVLLQIGHGRLVRLQPAGHHDSTGQHAMLQMSVTWQAAQRTSAHMVHVLQAAAVSWVGYFQARQVARSAQLCAPASSPDLQLPDLRLLGLYVCPHALLGLVALADLGLGSSQGRPRLAHLHLVLLQPLLILPLPVVVGLSLGL